MKKYSFDQVKNVIFQWVQNELNNKCLMDNKVEITKNEREILLIDLTFKHCLAQIVVSNPVFAPYKYVSFEALAWDSKKTEEMGTPEMIYFFYDNPNMTEREVLRELKGGLKICSQYIPDYLMEKYLNKKGILDIKKRDVCHMIHPNDRKIYDPNLTGESFICIDVAAQYLVIKSNIILRVLPKGFHLDTE